MSLRNPLAHARGLGSAKDGTHHWWWQRLTAVALVPLTVWMLAVLVAGAGSDYETARAMVAQPVMATLTIALLVALFHHAQLGLQVVVEDYVHSEWVKVCALLAIKFIAVLLALLASIAVLRIAVGS